MKKSQYFGLLAGCLILAVIGGITASYLASQAGWLSSEEEGVYSSDTFFQASLLREFQSKRASSWNTTGQNKDNLIIPPGEIRVIMEEQGAGCIKHFYWTYIIADEVKRNKFMRGLVLRAFWDKAKKPSIDVPIGDFFGASNGLMRPIESLAFTTNLGSEKNQVTWGFNCYLPMPFLHGVRIEFENQSDIEARIWYHIDHELYEKSSAIPGNAGRLHAVWNRENPTQAIPFEKSDDRLNMKNRWQMINLTGDENYSILDIEGNGLFMGYFLTVFNFKEDPWHWWGEGDDMIFIDGESWPPSFHGTGSEEIFGGGACPAREYSGPYTGFHCVENWGDENWLGTNGMYRFHIQDPIRFKKSIRVTIEHGHANNKSNDYSSVAFWYQEGINTNLPPLPPFEQRAVTSMPSEEEGL